MRKIKQLIKMARHQRRLRAMMSTQLSLLENDGLFAMGGLSQEEEEGVRLLVETCTPSQDVKPSCVVEFGTLFGITTLLLAQHKPAGMKIITVDNFCWNPFGLPLEMHKDFTRRILRPQIARGDVELVEVDSQSFRENYKGCAPRMVFIDACHSYEAVREEIARAKKIGVPLISGHDYGNPKFGVTQAVDEAFPDGVQVKGMVWSHGG